MDITTAPATAPSTDSPAGGPGLPDGLTLTPGRWELDTNHSSVGFAIRHLGVSKVRGAFRDVSAELVIDGPGEAGRLEVEVALASVDTGNADRDAHVRTADLLDVAVRPTMRFVATGVRGDQDRFDLSGDLTIGEVTQPVTFDVEFGGLEAFPADGRRHAGFEATGEIRRSDFGLDGGLLAGTFLGDVVKVELDVQFVEPAVGPAVDPAA